MEECVLVTSSHNTDDRAIVVTGMGIVSPLGNTIPEFWANLCRGKSGIAPLTSFDVADFPYHNGGEVHDLAAQGGQPAATDSVDPATRFMLAAADQAVRDADLTAAADPRATAVVLATNFGGMRSGEDLVAWITGDGPRTDAMLTEFNMQTGADRVANQWGWTGTRTVLSLSCASGAAAIAYGALLIRMGRATRVLAGGYDALTRFCWSGLGALRTMTKGALRPFDLNRDGTLFSEGAGALLLEDAAAARRRGVTPYAVVAGCATNNNAHHMTAPAPEGAGSARVMAAALRDGGIAPDSVDHINAHGTGTKANDSTETTAIKTVFGPHAARTPITSIKSMTGHLMGAAGSAEAIASILTMRDGIIPPTINYRDPDPECDLDIVANHARPATVKTVISNSAGIGGCNSAVVLRWTDACRAGEVAS
jgi:3-oxoacyl-[acyl-carrier-protein] synthase II